MIGTNQDARVLYDSLTFRSLLDSLARPGKINRLTYPHLYGDVPTYFSQADEREVAVNMYALGALLVLLDRETTFLVASDGEVLPLTAPIVRWTALRSGSSVAPLEEAAFALFCNRGNSGLLEQMSRGTLLAPELSATVIYAVEKLVATDSTQGELPEGALTLSLRGPGIQDVRRVSVQGITEADITAFIATRQSYPLGIDVYLIDAAGNCVGLPRTTKIVLQ